ncbi:MAG: hypothetical protein JNK02_05130 [Planctomycetes bacterium]|nr:hypothetical protein [Planctomycetota bacterium]
MVPTATLLLALAALALQAPGGTWTQARLEAATREILPQVEALRGAQFLRPVKVEVASTAGLRAYVEQREAALTTPARRHRDECVAKLLGLVPPAADLRALELEIVEGQVGGFYDPAADAFFLMDAMTGGGVQIILAHELTHALDDQHYELDALLAAANEDTDAELAIRCVIEGSGTNLMNRWTLAHGGSIPPGELAALQGMGAEALRKAPPVLWKPLVAAYFAGDAFLARTKGLNLMAKAAKPEDVERAFRDPPRTMEQVLHPDRYWDPARREQPDAVCFDVGSIPEGWAELAQDTLGEFALALLVTPPAERKGLDPTNSFALLSMKWTNEAAKGWGGDRLILLGRGDERLVQLVTTWDTARDADEFAAALAGAAPQLFAGPREAQSGFVPRFSPTWFEVERGEADGLPFVLVRAGCAAQDEPLAAVRLRWIATRPSAAADSAEDGR